MHAYKICLQFSLSLFYNIAFVLLLNKEWSWNVRNILYRIFKFHFKTMICCDTFKILLLKFLIYIFKNNFRWKKHSKNLRKKLHKIWEPRVITLSNLQLKYLA